MSTIIIFAGAIIVVGIIYYWRARQYKQLPEVTFAHPVLGNLRFDHDDKSWETTNDSVMYHGGISGDESGPSEESVQFIQDRLSNLDRYWELCSPMLREVWNGFARSRSEERGVRDIYHVAAISIYPEYWEICFETTSQHDRWLYVGIQIKDEEIISNTIDT